MVLDFEDIKRITEKTNSREIPALFVMRVRDRGEVRFMAYMNGGIHLYFYYMPFMPDEFTLHKILQTLRIHFINILKGSVQA